MSRTKKFFVNLFWSSPLLIAGVIGFVGAVISTLHELGFHVFEVTWERHAILGIVALLALALGIERFTRFEKIHQQFDSIQNKLSISLPTQEFANQISKILQGAFPARVLTGKEVYEETMSLVSAAEHSIKALVYEGEAADSSTVSVAIATHLEHHVTASFYLVLVVNWDAIDDKFWDIHRQRYEIYKGRHVERKVHRYIVRAEKPTGFDTLIIDDTHIGISFSPVATGDQSKQVGLRLSNQRAIAGLAGSWFQNEFLSPGAVITYEDAEGKWHAERAFRTRSS